MQSITTRADEIMAGDHIMFTHGWVPVLRALPVDDTASQQLRRARRVSESA